MVRGERVLITCNKQGRGALQGPLPPMVLCVPVFRAEAVPSRKRKGASQRSALLQGEGQGQGEYDLPASAVCSCAMVHFCTPSVSSSKLITTCWGDFIVVVHAGLLCVHSGAWFSNLML